MADNKISELYVVVKVGMSALKASLAQAFAAIKRFAGRVSEFALGNLLAGGIRSLASTLSGAFTGAIENAADLNEALSKTRAMMGENAAAAITFAQTMESRGVASAKEVLDSMSSTFSMLRNQGFSDAESYQLAADLEERVADIGSQMNKSGQEVRESIRSGLMGQYDSLSNIGVSTNAEMLDTRVAASGRGGTATASGRRRERTRESINEIMLQTGSAKGDFEATRYSFSNQKRTGDVRSQAVSARIGQDLLAVGQAFQYFRNKFMVAILAIANNGAFKKIGEMLTSAVTYVGQAVEGLLPTIMDYLIAAIEKFVSIIQFMATAVAAIATKPQAVLQMVTGYIQLAGLALADKLNWIASKLTLGLIGRDNKAEEKDAARERINASKEELNQQFAAMDAEAKKMFALFEQSSGQSASALAPQQQLSEGVKASSSSFNSLLSGVFGMERQYQATMQNLTQQIANNTKPKETGVQNVTGKNTLATATASMNGVVL